MSNAAPVPIDALQAAKSKQAASIASQRSPAEAAGVPGPDSFDPVTLNHQNAVRQDLNVLANQAGKYAAGVSAGNVQAIKQAADTNLRLDEQRAAQDAARAQEAEALRLKQEAQRQAAAQQIAEIQASAAAAAARRAASGGSDSDDLFKAKVAGDIHSVAIDYLGHTNNYTQDVLNTILGSAGTPTEASTLYQNLTANDPSIRKFTDPNTVNRYIDAHFQAANGAGYKPVAGSAPLKTTKATNKKKAFQ